MARQFLNRLVAAALGTGTPTANTALFGTAGGGSSAGQWVQAVQSAGVNKISAGTSGHANPSTNDLWVNTA